MTTLATPAQIVPASPPMMKAIVRLPHISWRDGRPRFQPGPALRKLGFKGRDLQHPTGAWFTLGECEKEAELLAAEIEAARRAKAAGHKATPASSRTERYITVGNLIAEFFALPELNGLEIVEGKKRRKPLKPKTVIWYRKLSKAVEDDAPVFWQAIAAAVDAVTLDGVIETIEKKRGLATARGCRALLSTAWGKVGKRHRLSQSVFADMDELPVLTGRTRAGSPAQMAALIKAADAIGLPQIGDSVMLGLATSQRQVDRLALEARGVVNGRLKLQQGKRGAMIDCPLWPSLIARLEASAERRRSFTVQWPQVIIDERLRKPYSEDGTDYRHDFAKAREAAIAGVIDAEATAAQGKTVYAVEPCPELAGFHDQDLRDTAATWAYSALRGDLGPDLAKSKVKAITGHKGGDNNAVLNNHYLDVQAENADTTVSAVIAWLGAQGVKL